MSEYHIPVLLHEVLEYLAVEKGRDYIDATAGGGGHTVEILHRGGRVLAIDQDEEAIEQLEIIKKKNNNEQLTIVQDNFRNIKKVAQDNGFEKVDGILFDLGVSSHQLDSNRGFSFLRDESLDMRMDQRQQVNALDVINTYPEEKLVDIFLRWGEEIHAEKIAAHIVDFRKKQRIETTGTLAAIIEEVVPRTGMIHPATKVFQAVRIAVNDELEVLKEALQDAYTVLNKQGVLAVISFHSLEDRVVKQVFLQLEQKQLGQIITKKPVTATDEEIAHNRRSRSAKLRIFKKNI